MLQSTPCDLIIGYTTGALQLLSGLLFHAYFKSSPRFSCGASVCLQCCVDFRSNCSACCAGVCACVCVCVCKCGCIYMLTCHTSIRKYLQLYFFLCSPTFVYFCLVSFLSFAQLAFYSFLPLSLSLSHFCAVVCLLAKRGICV